MSRPNQDTGPVTTGYSLGYNPVFFFQRLVLSKIHSTLVTHTATRRTSLPGQFLAVVVASLAAITANVILYFILERFFGVDFIAPEQFPLPDVSPLPVTDVIIFSFVFCAGASLIFMMVVNISRQPARLFSAISIIFLVISCFLPLRIPTPPVPMLTKLSLVSMHILGAVVLVPLLIFIGLPRNNEAEKI